LLGLVVGGFAFLVHGLEGNSGLFGGALNALRVESHALEAGVFVAPGLGLRGHSVEVGMDVPTRARRWETTVAAGHASAKQAMGPRH